MSVFNFTINGVQRFSSFQGQSNSRVSPIKLWNRKTTLGLNYDSLNKLTLRLLIKLFALKQPYPKHINVVFFIHSFMDPTVNTFDQSKIKKTMIESRTQWWDQEHNDRIKNTMKESRTQ